MEPASSTENPLSTERLSTLHRGREQISQVMQGIRQAGYRNMVEEWQTVYTDGKAYGVGEMMETRPIHDFIMAVLPTEPSFANAHLITLDSKEEKDFHPLIESFRKYVRLHQTQKNKNSNTHSAFATEKKKDRERHLMGKKRLPNVFVGPFIGTMTATI